MESVESILSKEVARLLNENAALKHLLISKDNEIAELRKTIDDMIEDHSYAIGDAIDWAMEGE